MLLTVPLLRRLALIEGRAIFSFRSAAATRRLPQ
jgi:hypothetical protein